MEKETVTINGKEFYLGGLIIEVVKNQSQEDNGEVAIYRTRSGSHYAATSRRDPKDDRFTVIGMTYFKEFDKSIIVLSSTVTIQNVPIINVADMERIAAAFNQLGEYRNPSEMCVIADWIVEQQQFKCSIFKKIVQDYTEPNVEYQTANSADKIPERKVKQVKKNVNANGLTEREQLLLDKITEAVQQNGQCISKEVTGKDLSQIALLSTLKTKGKIDTRKEGSGKNKVTIITLK